MLQTVVSSEINNVVKKGTVSHLNDAVCFVFKSVDGLVVLPSSYCWLEEIVGI